MNEIYNKLREIHKTIVHKNYDDALERTILLMEFCLQEKNQMSATELIDLLFPKHDKCSCEDGCDNSVCCYDECISGCSRCTALAITKNPDKARLLQDTYIGGTINKKVAKEMMKENNDEY